MLVAAAGCASPPGGLDSPIASQRAEGIAEAAEENDQNAVKPLIGMLDSDDPAIRMFAITALQDLTGQTLGYDYAAPEWERAESVDRWTAWYSERAGVASAPGGGLTPPGR